MRFPNVLARAGDGDTRHFELDISEDLIWFKGHFPGYPVLPGVVQLRWAVELADESFGVGIGPREVMRLKFKSVIVPPLRVELTLRQTGCGEVQFAYASKGHDYSQGKLIFNGFDQ